MGPSRVAAHHCGAIPAPTYNLAVDDIKNKARDRGRQLKLPYAGALLPDEAHALMQRGARLVDVRTDAELHYVGSVPGSVTIEWSNYPAGVRNPDFVAQLQAAVRKDEPVMFLCRSGVRSHHAAIAATQAGWNEAYNILEGFEGDKDADGHRNTVGGWRRARLPWVQS
jgi:rhodanese-related sulfurtransferase